MPRRTITEPASTTDQSTTQPRLREQIAARAFELYLERGGEHGHDVEDWLRAEQEVVSGHVEVAAVA